MGFVDYFLIGGIFQLRQVQASWSAGARQRRGPVAYLGITMLDPLITCAV
jgi:hypothetical protein